MLSMLSIVEDIDLLGLVDIDLLDQLAIVQELLYLTVVEYLVVLLDLVALGIPGELDKDSCKGLLVLLVKADQGIVKMERLGNLEDIEVVELIVQFLQNFKAELAILDTG